MSEQEEVSRMHHGSDKQSAEDCSQEQQTEAS